MLFRCLICLSFVLLSMTTYAQLRDFQTSRLISTAGTGVGSILLDEATQLNPAPLAFFTETSIDAQKWSGKFENQKSDPTTQDKMNNWNFVISDGNGSLGTSFAYETQKFGNDKRRRMALAFGMPTSERSAAGVTVRQTKDTVRDEEENATTTTKYQFIFGATHILGPQFSIGVIAIDPFRKVPEDTRVILGLQYVYEDFISLMFDGGANYSKDIANTTQYHAGIQFKVYDDFFLRTGFYEDKAKHERGTGAGVGWVSPRLLFEASIANKTLTPFEQRIYKQKATETSFSLSIRF